MCDSTLRMSMVPNGVLPPDVMDALVHAYAEQVGLGQGYAADSMRATFITTALDNGATLEDVQRTLGPAHPSTT